jgi:hypothetical protein
MRVAEMFTPVATGRRNDWDWDEWDEREHRYHHGHWRYYYRWNQREWRWDD